jgi:CPW-WPC domain-containing protein
MAQDAQAKHAASTNSAANDVYLANAMTRGSLDQDAFMEVMQAGDIGACPECLHDYAVACPGGWIPTQANGSCKALGSDYAGPCPLELFVDQMTANDKANMEIRCSVCWPCKQDAARAQVSRNGPIDPSNGEVLAA